MKKTFEDRQRFIDHLERKYAEKISIHRHNRQQGFKNALKKIRGMYFSFEDIYSSPTEEFFHRNTKSLS